MLTVAPRTFHRFPDLPNELQADIWDVAADATEDDDFARQQFAGDDTKMASQATLMVYSGGPFPEDRKNLFLKMFSKKFGGNVGPDGLVFLHASFVRRQTVLRACKKAFEIVNVTWDPNDIWDDGHKCEIKAAKRAKAQILGEIEHLIK